MTCGPRNKDAVPHDSPAGLADILTVGFGDFPQASSWPSCGGGQRRARSRRQERR
jgi:hypothetical protein